MILSDQSASARGREDARPVGLGRWVEDRALSSVGCGHRVGTHASAARPLRAFLPAAAILILIFNVASGDIPPREPSLVMLRIGVRNGASCVIKEASLEDYVRVVVPSEVPSGFHPEALRAQAIVARTWALRNRGRHAAEGYDFCDSTHCQVYRGVGAVTPETDAAVRATRGLVITYQGELIDPVYHSTCGGHTADSEAVWRGGRPTPYLRGVSDRASEGCYCADSPHAWWKCTLTSSELASVAGLPAPVTISVDGRDANGRVTMLTLTGGGQQRSMTGCEFYRAAARAVGAGRVRSAWFDIRPGSGITLIGRGSGHGVGMCQWGANGRAHAGQTAEQILRHYYGSQVRIERWP